MNDKPQKKLAKPLSNPAHKMVKDKGIKIIHKSLETAYPPAQPPISGINKLLKLFLLSTFNSESKS